MKPNSKMGTSIEGNKCDTGYQYYVRKSNTWCGRTKKYRENSLLIVAGDLALARRNPLGLANLKAVASQFARDFLKLGTRDDEQIEFTERGKPAAILVQKECDYI